jgi:hypothetical protein
MTVPEGTLEVGSEFLVENGDDRGQAIISTAMSLKRIADAVEGTPSKMGLVDGIMHAIEQGFIAARNG